MKPTFTTDRRMLLQAGLGLGLTAGTMTTASSSTNIDQLDLSSPSGTLKNYVKLLGTLSESVVYVSFGGTLWGIPTDELPVALCGFKGLARMQWTPREDGSFHRKSFDVGYFSDLDTGAPLESMTNPLTGETVEPFHYKYGGAENIFSERGIHRVSGEGESEEPKPFDLDWKTTGNQIWLTESGGGEYPSPMPAEDWPRESSGDFYRFVGETSFVSTVEQLADPSLSQADYSLFWSSILSWEPWLLMDGKPGLVMWRGVGAKLRDYNDADPQLLEYVRSEQKNYFDAGDPWDGVLSNIDRFKNLRQPAK